MCNSSGTRSWEGTLRNNQSLGSPIVFRCRKLKLWSHLSSIETVEIELVLRCHVCFIPVDVWVRELWDGSSISFIFISRPERNLREGVDGGWLRLSSIVSGDKGRCVVVEPHTSHAEVKLSITEYTFQESSRVIIEIVKTEASCAEWICYLNCSPVHHDHQVLARHGGGRVALLDKGREWIDPLQSWVLCVQLLYCSHAREVQSK